MRRGRRWTAAIWMLRRLRFCAIAAHGPDVVVLTEWVAGRGAELFVRLAKSLGVDVPVHAWEFEAVPIRADGTNVDVLWTTVGGARVFCEVKLSETEFGQARNDLRHQTKLTQLYAPRLRSLVSDELLVPATFFKHYQLLRNISQLAESDVDRLVFLLPRENEALRAPLDRVLSRTVAGVRRRIHIAHVEDCIDALEVTEALPGALRMHLSALKEKYIPSAVDVD